MTHYLMYVNQKRNVNTKYIYSSTVQFYSYFFLIFCYFTLLLHYISGGMYVLLHYIYFQASVTC